MGGVHLADVVASRENNFDVLRLGAAMVVLLEHCIPLTAAAVPALGGLYEAVLIQGVTVFFAISGFLIARSWVSAPRARTYAAKRALRLIPGLVVAVVFTSFVIGPLFTSLSLGAYLSDPAPYVYVLRCALLITFAGTLPGVFTDNPFPDAVNGVLWTLPVEACAYLIVGMLGVAGLLVRRWILPLAFACALVLGSPLVDLDSLLTIGDGNTGDAALVSNLIATFLAGSLLFVHHERVTLSWWLAVPVAILWWVVAGSPWDETVAALVIPYLVLMGAYRTPASWRRLTRPGDVSYGVYVYAFPIQQSVVALWSGVRPLTLFAIAAPLAYAAGLASWRFIERPALDLKRRLPGGGPVEGRSSARDSTPDPSS